MPGRECYHCKQWVEAGEAHDCHTTTEAALTRDLPEDLQDAWRRLRDTAAGFGDQRIYASLNSIMFSRAACYTFVRPKPKYLEVCIFLGRPLKSPIVRKSMPASKTKVANLLRITHRDQVESPITDWMQEAYAASESLSAAARTKTAPGTKKASDTKKKASGTTKTTRLKKKAASTKAKTAAKKKRPTAQRKS